MESLFEMCIRDRILYPLKDGFKVRDAGKYRGYETNCTDSCVIYLLHSSDTPVSYTHLDVYKRQATHKSVFTSLFDMLITNPYPYISIEYRSSTEC